MTKPEQIRAARALLNLSQAKLGEVARVSPARIFAIESGADHLASTKAAIVSALENRGVVFGADGSVRLEEKAKPFIALDGYHQGDGTPRATKERVDAAKSIVEAGKRRRTPGGFA